MHEKSHATITNNRNTLARRNYGLHAIIFQEKRRGIRSVHVPYASALSTSMYSPTSPLCPHPCRSRADAIENLPSLDAPPIAQKMKKTGTNDLPMNAEISPKKMTKKHCPKNWPTVLRLLGGNCEATEGEIFVEEEVKINKNPNKTCGSVRYPISPSRLRHSLPPLFLPRLFLPFCFTGSLSSTPRYACCFDLGVSGKVIWMRFFVSSGRK